MTEEPLRDRLIRHAVRNQTGCQMDMKPETRAPLAYARIRGNVREGSKPMPHWDDLQEVERILLMRMWSLGVEDAVALLREKLDKEPL